MPDSLMRRFAPQHAQDQSRADADGSEVDDLIAFGFLRGRERALMVQLRRKDGSSIAFANAWLEKVEFDPSGGVTLQFGRNVVRLTGRNLNAEVRPNVRLVDSLMRHKVPYVQESSGAAAMAASKDAVVIERIEIE